MRKIRTVFLLGLPRLEGSLFRIIRSALWGRGGACGEHTAADEEVTDHHSGAGDDPGDGIHRHEEGHIVV